MLIDTYGTGQGHAQTPPTLSLKGIVSAWSEKVKEYTAV